MNIAKAGRELEADDDQVIRLRASGLSYTDIGRQIGVTASGAQHRYRMARARQIPPETIARSHERPAALVIAWAAGFVDGEGCIYGYENRAGAHGRFQFGVLIGQAVREPLEELRSLWGGTIHSVQPRQAHHKPQWRWQIGGRDAAAFLEDVLPHLRVKFDPAKIAISYLYRVHTTKQRFSAREIADRRVAVASLRVLNRRGPLG